MNAGFQIQGSSSDRCVSCPAKDAGVCGCLTDAASNALASRSNHSRIAAGKTIGDQGSPSERVGIVVSGMVKVVHINENGDENVLQVLHPGALIGDPFGSENAVSYETATDATLCWLPRKALDALCHENPEIYRGLLAGVIQQMEQQHLWSASMRGRSTTQRLAFWLLSQMPNGAPERGTLITIRLSRRELASFLDMSIETLCRVLHQIAGRKAIRLLSPERVELLDVDLLRILAKSTDERVERSLRVKSAKPRQATGKLTAKPRNSFAASGVRQRIPSRLQPSLAGK